jgi:hypothetical protein
MLPVGDPVVDDHDQSPAEPLRAAFHVVTVAAGPDGRI